MFLSLFPGSWFWVTGGKCNLFKVTGFYYWCVNQKDTCREPLINVWIHSNMDYRSYLIIKWQNGTKTKKERKTRAHSGSWPQLPVYSAVKLVNLDQLQTVVSNFSHALIYYAREPREVDGQAVVVTSPCCLSKPTAVPEFLAHKESTESQSTESWNLVGR